MNKIAKQVTAYDKIKHELRLPAVRKMLRILDALGYILKESK